MSEISQRKGARSLKEIPANILNLLNKGAIESVNLTEWLAVDQSVLIDHVFSEEYSKICISAIDKLNNKTITQVIRTVGETIKYIIDKNENENLLNELSTHRSDMVRCWAAYAIGMDEKLNISEKLIHIRPFAADHHFGVREIAWMAVRNDIETNLDIAISILSDWTKDEDENIRRFASEVTRPHGVWSKHIDELKKNPQKALCILDPLKADASKYVQDSVGNWLNDASKTNADFVKELCSQWDIDATKETKYIIKKALRTIAKKGKE